MTKKHLEVIAAAIKEEQTAVAVREDTRRAIAIGIAAAMRDANPRFDTEKFMKAAGF